MLQPMKCSILTLMKEHTMLYFCISFRLPKKRTFLYIFSCLLQTSVVSLATDLTEFTVPQ